MRLDLPEAQRHEREHGVVDLLVVRRQGAPGAGGFPGPRCADFVAQLDDDALGGFFADAGNLRERFDVARGHRPAKRRHADAAQAPINALRAEENVLRRLRGQPDLPVVSSLHSPTFFQADLRVSKPFSMRDGRGKGAMFLQVFNLLDRVNGGLVDGRVISPTFGKAIGLAGPPRTMELGVKLGY